MSRQPRTLPSSTYRTYQRPSVDTSTNREFNIGDRWKRFYGYNTGLWNGNWGDNEQLRKRDNRAMLDAIASQLGLTRHQRERARYLLYNFRFSKYSPYDTVRDISVIICLLVANADFRGDGWVYRKGMYGLDALQVVALEERITTDEPA